MVSSFTVPLSGFPIVLNYTSPLIIKQSKIELRPYIILLGRFAEPGGCLCIVSFISFPGIIEHAYVILSRHISAKGRPQEPLCGFSIIPVYTISLSVKKTHVILRQRIAAGFCLTF